MFKGMDNQVKTFGFDDIYCDKPSTFSIDIMLDNITYHYEFSIKDKKVIYEFLSKKYRRTEVLLERISPKNKDILLKSDLKGFDIYKQAVKEEALCLGIAHALDVPLAIKLVYAINSINVFNMASPRLRPTDPKKSFSIERKQKYVNVLKKADPTLRNINISVKEEDIQHPIDSDDFENREIITKKTSVAVETEHAVYRNGIEESSKVIDFFNDESVGTVKLFTILPYLFDILEQGGVMVLDEIENGLHPSLVKDMIKLFTDSVSNPNNSQLICTTHQPLLVEGNTRRDQVWVISKDEFGKSNIYRLSDMRTSRAKVNLANRLLENAFGCNPKPFFQ
jgi:AAA15 family ATPase/GTPase